MLIDGCRILCRPGLAERSTSRNPSLGRGGKRCIRATYNRETRPVGRRSVSGGVTPLGAHRIQFDLTVDGVRYRPTLPWIPLEANLRRAKELLIRIRARIAAGTFIHTEDFPDFRGRKTLHLPFSARTCADVFDAFLLHEAARVRRGDLAPVTLAAHREIPDHVSRPEVGPAVTCHTLFNTCQGGRRTPLDEEDLQQCDQRLAARVRFRFPGSPRASQSGQRSQECAHRQERSTED
jgi:hypothetical protein